VDAGVPETVDGPASGKRPEPVQGPPRARPLTECLAEIATQAGRGLVVAPNVSGEAVAVFDPGMPWGDRLAALARIHEFHYAVSDRLIEAWSKRPEDAAANAGEAGQKGERPGLKLEPPAITIVDRPVHARADDLVTAVSKAARATKVQVSADPGSNAVVIAGAEAEANVISELVRTLDVPRRRFVLEAEIVELSRKARQALGVRWSIDGTVGAIVNFPTADAEGEGGSIVVATDGAHALRARISALAADGHVRVVSRPRVVVLEGRPASIESVRILRVRFPEQTAIVGEAQDAQGVSGGRAVEEIPVGVTLRVEPSMRGDGKIVLRIRAKSSTLGPPQPPDDIPEEFSRMVDAEVAVADGETAVLGGLMREGLNRSGTGVPVLRSVPLVGVLFGKREHSDDEEELVVLVTPRLLPP
jgi:type II secretory pathway component GspD/PulD (secretin)